MQKYHNLLHEPLLSVTLSDGDRRRVTLPDILFHLSNGGILSFDLLQPHQQQSWYSFLVQLSALALSRGHIGALTSTAEHWSDALIKLSADKQEPWCMVVEDHTKAAFFQSPIPEGSFQKAKYKNDILTPDDLDVLITSKNHDVKMRRVARPTIEHWVYALITLQTTEGFLGRGNYGIVRMNGGFGNRPLVGLVPGIDWSSRFKRDVQMFLDSRQAILQERYNPNGKALLWLYAWDGSKDAAIPLDECDPYFIEICRRIRFTSSDDQLLCWRANSDGARIIASDKLNGDTGDPWTPIELKGAKALTLGERGFDYKIIEQLLLGEEYHRPQGLEFTENEKDGGYLVASALVRGQGKTDGLHHKAIPIPPKVSRMFLRKPTARQQMATEARSRIKKTADVQSKVLSFALRVLLSAGSNDKVDFDTYARWVNAFDKDIDALFFEELWRIIDVEPQEAQKRWEECLYRMAKKQFADAMDSAPIPDIRKLRAHSRAEWVFERQSRKLLTEYFSTN